MRGGVLSISAKVLCILVLSSVRAKRCCCCCLAVVICPGEDKLTIISSCQKSVEYSRFEYSIAEKHSQLALALETEG